MDLIKNEIIPPELEEEARFLAAEKTIDLENAANNVTIVKTAIEKQLSPSGV